MNKESGEIVSYCVKRASEESKYRFTGQEYDEETDLHNYKARFYDSMLMRFYTVDPAEEQASPYTYVANNPVMLVDPDGKRAVKKAIYELNYFHAIRYGNIHKPNKVKVAQCNQIEYFGYKGGYGTDFGLDENMYSRRLDYERKGWLKEP